MTHSLSPFKLYLYFSRRSPYIPSSFSIMSIPSIPNITPSSLYSCHFYTSFRFIISFASISCSNFPLPAHSLAFPYPFLLPSGVYLICQQGTHLLIAISDANGARECHFVEIAPEWEPLMGDPDKVKKMSVSYILDNHMTYSCSVKFLIFDLEAQFFFKV